MPKPLKPPRGVFVSSTVIFLPSLKAQVRDTLIQLLALAWGSESHHTPPLSLPQLAALTGKSIGRLYGHIAILRDEHTALRLQGAGDGQTIICFADWLFPNASPGASRFEKPKLPDEEEESVNDPNKTCKTPPPVNDPDNDRKNPEPCSQPADKSSNLPTKPGQANRLTDELSSLLLSAGVFPSLLEEVAASGKSEADLKALLAWSQADKPESPAALFIGRLRSGARAREIYYQAPCPCCGQYGTHRDDCRKRYRESIYRDLIEDGSE